VPQTQSCFLVQIHAKVYQFDTHTSENKKLHDLSSYDVIIKNKNQDIHHCKETDHVYAIVRTGHGQPTWSIPATWFWSAPSW